MAVTGTLGLTGRISGEPEGTSDVSLTWTITAGVSDAFVFTTETGNQTVTVPTGTTMVIVVPPTTNAQAITAKGVGADTGFQVSKTKPTVIAWETGSSFVLNLAAAVSGLKVLFI